MADDAPTTPPVEETEEQADVLAPGEGLTMVQSLFVRLTIEGKGLHEAAEACGKDVRTMYRWLKEPAVKAAIAEGTMAGLLRARSVLTSRAAHAADALTRMCTDKGTGALKPDQSRVAACRAVLEIAVKLGEYAGDAAPTKHDLQLHGGVMVVPEQMSEQAWEAAAREHQQKLAEQVDGSAPAEPTKTV